MRKTEDIQGKSVLFFLEGRDVPSSRFRIMQFDQLLRERGVAVRYLYTRPNKYLYCPSSLRQTPLYPLLILPELLIIVLTRIVQILLYGRSADVIVLQRDLLYRVNYPFLELLLFSFTAKKRSSGQLRIIFDVDDAIYLNKKGERSPGLERKLSRICSFCDLVLAGNSSLAEYFSRFTSTEILPTVVDTARYVPSGKDKDQACTIIAWSGTSRNLVYLQALLPALNGLAKKYPLRLRIICDQAPNFEEVSEELQVEFVPWSREVEVSELDKAHIGVMPLEKTAWSEGKCGFKLLQYLALEIAAVASPVGVNEDLITHGENGFLASTEKEWLEALETLIQNPEKRRQLGLKGRELVESRYSTRHVFEKWVRYLFQSF